MKKLLIGLTGLFLTTACLAGSLDLPFSQQKEVQHFIKTMSKKHGMDSKKLTQQFSQFKPEKKVLALMSKQYEALPWFKYQRTIVTDQRIQEGVAFWKKHHKTLSRIEKQYGVHPAVIVSIIGIETRYGQIQGKFPVLQSLSTLAFHYPRRSAFFKKELEQFLLLTQEGSLDPLTTTGSFAGAMGMPQFMPSSYHRFAVDFSKKGKRDLIANPEDVLSSVGNYLHKNGWKPRQPVTWLAPTRLLSQYKNTQDLRAQQGGALMKAYQLQHLPRAEKIKIIVLKGERHPQRLVGLPNFYAIMRYNNSVHYAMAVHELSQKIQKHYKGLK